MQSQRDELLNQLTEHGWQLKRKEQDLDWWADEMWMLESLWSPVGTVAYVTFLVDPQSGAERKKGQDVWAVQASPSRPIERIRGEGEYTTSLGQGWKDRLSGLFEYLASLRK